MEFKKIMDLSEQSMKFDKGSMTNKQCKQWLEERRKLDSRMEILLKRIEDYWLGDSKVSYIYKCLFITCLLFCLLDLLQGNGKSLQIPEEAMT